MPYDLAYVRKCAAAYRDAWTALVDALVGARENGVGANKLARTVAGLPGFGRNSVLGFLAADRLFYDALRAIDNATITEVGAAHTRDPEDRDLAVYLYRIATEPIGTDTAQHIVLTLAQAGLTLDRHDPVATLTQLEPDQRVPIIRIKSRAE